MAGISRAQIDKLRAAVINSVETLATTPGGSAHPEAVRQDIRASARASRAFRSRRRPANARALLGKPVLTYNPLSADKYHNVLDLMGAIHDVMEREGDWKPRDLWDVQGFIWAVNRADNAQPEIAASTSAHRPL